MSFLKVSVVGFDITPEIHPKFGAWGTTPSLTEIDQPLLARCIAIEQGDQQVIWFGSDLCGENVPGTDLLRDVVADELSFTRQQIIWSTSQTHSSPTLPGSPLPGGCSITERGTFDQDYCDQQWEKIVHAYKQAARQAMETLQPATLWVGHGFCDAINYNRRFPMPDGGVKFSRHHSEGLKGGKYVDSTIGLVRFDDQDGRPIGAIFNFCAHPATMINNKYVSPDWVGNARMHVERTVAGAPAMFVQGMCGDVNCRYIFGTPKQARRNGDLLGRAAADAMKHLIPVREVPFDLKWQTRELACRPMYTRPELEQAITTRENFIEELEDDPAATWLCGINIPEQMTPEGKAAFVQVQISYLKEGMRLLDTKEPVRTKLPVTLGAMRLGDLAIVLSPGENFTATGRDIRNQSPFSHTLICGDTNGLFGYIGDDSEIDRGGYETDSYWKMLYIDGFRLALAKGATDTIHRTYVRMLKQLSSSA